MSQVEAITLTKALVRAADQLGISRRVLASIVGLSESTISRMRNGGFVLERRNGKAFELAQLFIHLYVLLDRVVAGDELVARAWLIAENSTFGGRPIDLIQSVSGLTEVVGYLQMETERG